MHCFDTILALCALALARGADVGGATCNCTAGFGRSVTGGVVDDFNGCDGCQLGGLTYPECNPTVGPTNGPTTCQAGPITKDGATIKPLSPYCNSNGICNEAGTGCVCTVVAADVLAGTLGQAFVGDRCDQCAPGHNTYPDCFSTPQSCHKGCSGHGVCEKKEATRVCYARSAKVGEPYKATARTQCLESQTCCTATVTNTPDGLGYDDAVSCCNADETCCGNGQCCKAGTEACRGSAGSVPNWKNIKGVWVDGKIKNGMVWTGKDFLNFMPEGAESAYCYETKKDEERTPCGHSADTSCDKGWQCSDDQIGVCTKMGRTPCYPRFNNGSAATSMSSVGRTGALKTLLDAGGCLPDQQCCQSGDELGPSATCISGREACYDTPPPEDGFKLNQEPNWVDWPMKVKSDYVMTHSTVIRIVILPLLEAVFLLFLHILVIKSIEGNFFQPGVLPSTLIVVITFFQMFGNKDWKYFVLLCIASWVSLVFHGRRDNKVLQGIAVLFVFASLAVALGGLGQGVLLLDNAPNVFFPNLPAGNAGSEFSAQQQRQRDCTTYWGTFKVDPNMYTWYQKAAGRAGGPADFEVYSGYCRADYIAFLDLLSVLAFLVYQYITVRFIVKFGDRELNFVDRGDIKRLSMKSNLKRFGSADPKAYQAESKAQEMSPVADIHSIRVDRNSGPPKSPPPPLADAKVKKVISEEWTEATSPKHDGAPYWVNRKTGESTWTNPTAAV